MGKQSRVVFILHHSFFFFLSLHASPCTQQSCEFSWGEEPHIKILRGEESHNLKSSGEESQFNHLFWRTQEGTQAGGTSPRRKAL